MSTTILEGSDGTLYDIPNEVLARFAVPGPKVQEIRQRMAKGSSPAAAAAAPAPTEAPGDHPKLGELAPDHPGYAQQQAIQAAVQMARAEGGAGGSGVTLNVYVGGGNQPAVSLGINGQSIDVNAAAADEDSGVEGYHMSFDENGVPVNHTDMLWGDYIDKQGNPAVGFHSHDPVHGNAQ